MNDAIPAELVDRMTVTCARRCCICRRFRPTKLPVHHIRERNQGGGNDEDNLIVTCMSCHSDVHTKVPFARRFSEAELKGHRDALVALVAAGTFPEADTGDADAVMAALLRGTTTERKVRIGLSSEAQEMLLAAALAAGPHQGAIALESDSGGFTADVGTSRQTIGNDDKRSMARYKRVVKELADAGPLDQLSASHFEVADAGYLAADELTVAQAAYPNG